VADQGVYGAGRPRGRPLHRPSFDAEREFESAGTKLTNERGGRQTEGTITVGDTWSRAAKVSETSSFEVKAGGTTAAVQGTAFAFSCTLVNGQLSCTVIAVVDTVQVTSGSGQVELPPAT